MHPKSTLHCHSGSHLKRLPSHNHNSTKALRRSLVILLTNCYRVYLSYLLFAKAVFILHTEAQWKLNREKKRLLQIEVPWQLVREKGIVKYIVETVFLSICITGIKFSHCFLYENSCIPQQHLLLF